MKNQSPEVQKNGGGANGGNMTFYIPKDIKVSGNDGSNKQLIFETREEAKKHFRVYIYNVNAPEYSWLQFDQWLSEQNVIIKSEGNKQ
jgi:hypothetical protein